MSFTKLSIYFIFLLSTSVPALHEPNLLTAASWNAGMMDITWRNNDPATSGFLFYFKANGTNSWQFNGVQTSSGSTMYIYTNLIPGATYQFALKAFNSTDTSVMSNELTAAVKVKLPLYSNPTLSVTFDTVSSSASLVIKDSSEAETGYEIYKRTLPDNEFKKVHYIASENPYNRGTLNWTDTAMKPNAWYVYYAKTIVPDSIWKISVKKINNAKDSTSSSPCTIFTLKYGSMISDTDSVIVLKDKITEYVLSLNSFSMLVGDTIVFGEKGKGEEYFSMIDVSDPSNPKFVGCKTSYFLVNYKTSLGIDSLLYIGDHHSLYLNYPKINELRYKNGEFFGFKELQTGEQQQYGAYPYIENIYGVFNDSILLYKKYVSSMGHWTAWINNIDIKKSSNDTNSVEIDVTSDIHIWDQSYFNGILFLKQIGKYGDYDRGPFQYRVLNYNGLSANVDTIVQSKIPRKFGNYYYLNYQYQRCPNILLDNIKRIAYVCANDILYIYKYEAVPQKDIRSNAVRCVVNNKKVNIYNTPINVYDILGRRINVSSFLPDNTKHNINMRHGNNGVYILKTDGIVTKRVNIR